MPTLLPPSSPAPDRDARCPDARLDSHRRRAYRAPWQSRRTALLAMTAIESPTIARKNGNASRGVAPRTTPATPAVPPTVVVVPVGVTLRTAKVTEVGDVDVAGAVDRHACRRVEARRGAGSVRAAGHARGAGKGRHDAGGSDLAEGVVVRVSDIDVTRAVDRHACRRVEARRGAGTIHVAGTIRVAREKLQVDSAIPAAA
jgi:hypothetical protein